MIILIEGLAGSGKTLFMTRLIKKEWKAGQNVFPNFPLWYETTERIRRWHNLDETYSINNGIIAIDESQKFLDARKWQSLPATFTEKIAMHRHHGIDIYSTTQDMGHIDKRLRTNIHVLYHCQSLFRFPVNQKVKPIIQIIRITKRNRKFSNESNRLTWHQASSRLFFISRYFTKTYYNTYGDVGQEKFLCKIKYKKKASEKQGKWSAKVFSREILDRGKKRL